MSLLEATHIRKQFGGLTAVNDLSFQLEENEILGLIGPNGAGKTTVFNCLTGLLPMDAGRVHLEDKPIAGLKPHQICRLGMARTFQIVRPFLNISVCDNVMVGTLLR
ncbi:MAG: ATP-binding cassette domain-containing protein, partial [bacterium]|nr:ATP-binding cassette domain-containing protein [bacterium]